MDALKAAARRVGLRSDHLRSARVLAERRWIAARGRRRPGDEPACGRILCYHGVGTPEWGYNDLPPARFRHQLELALSRGYRFVDAAVIARTGGEPRDLAITFDDGLRSVGDNAAPILCDLHVPWTMFAVSGWTSGQRWPDGERLFLRWDELTRLAANGMTLGSHSVSHPNFKRLDPELARRELVDSRREIEAATGLRVDAFAIPFGQSTDWTDRCTQLARDAGYEIVYAQAVDTRLPGTVPRTFITGWDDDRVFQAALEGAFDAWEERL